MTYNSYEEAKNALSCPHTDDCEYYDIRYEEEASTKEGELMVSVECHSCTGQDHLTFTPKDSRVVPETTPYRIDEEFTIEEDHLLLRGIDESKTVIITNIVSGIGTDDDRYVCFRGESKGSFAKYKVEKVNVYKFNGMVDEGILSRDKH